MFLFLVYSVALLHALKYVYFVKKKNIIVHQRICENVAFLVNVIIDLMGILAFKLQLYNTFRLFICLNKDTSIS